MALRPRLLLGLSTHLLTAYRFHSLKSSSVVWRKLSTSLRNAHPEPSSDHQGLVSGHFRSPRGTATLDAKDEPGTTYDPYEDGPGALDKAVHLFFFTEILRGAFGIQAHLYAAVADVIGMQGCGLC
jgi:NADH dehydrogenase (ubiquinone) Fe-S protein 8